MSALLGWITFGLVALGLGVLLLLAGREVRRLRAAVRAGKPAQVSEAVDGPVQLQGRAVPRRTLRAPVSGAEVIGYRLRVEALADAPANEGGERWELLFDDTRVNEFELDDGTGRALVDPRGAQIVLALESEGPFDLSAEALDAVLTEHGQYTAWVAGRPLRYQERLLDLDEQVFVCGQGRLTVALEAEGGSYRQAPRQLVVRRPDAGPLIISDSPRDLLLQRLPVSSLSAVPEIA